MCVWGGGGGGGAVTLYTVLYVPVLGYCNVFNIL